MSDVTRRDALRRLALAFTAAGFIDRVDAREIHDMASQATAAGGAYTPKTFTSDQFKTAINNIGDEVAYLDSAGFAKFWDEDAKRVEAAVHAIGRVQG